MKKILVTGATGQIGSELTLALRKRYGSENVVAAAHKKKPGKELLEAGPLCYLDVRDTNQIKKAVTSFRINTIYHLAAILSAVAEDKPQFAWDINMNGLFNVLETARNYDCAVFVPSSIGAFGPGTPSLNTPQDTIQRPTTMYGITKVAGELLCDYYHLKYQIDTRGLRFPGLISYKTLPGGGTTDYAVEIFYAALMEKQYDCFLKPNTRLDMMYMPDALRASIELMEADPKQLKHRNAFNVTAMSITPRELAREIKKHIPEFEIRYKVDPIRQAIAESWPRHLDDRSATNEWGWQPEFDLSEMVKNMLEKLSVE